MRAPAFAALALALPLAACAPVQRCPPAAAAQPSSGQVLDTLASTHFTLHSGVLGEDRTINVYLPPDYGASTERYPVLYMLDGGLAEDFPHVAGSVDVSIKNGVIRPVIVVGVQNTERRRDLLSPTSRPDEQAMAPHAGGSDRFRAFLRDELRPHIDAGFRTSREAALAGESFAGLFVIETMLVAPSMFDDYIAADPSVWWNDHELVGRAAQMLGALPASPMQLYVAASDDGIHTGVPALVDALSVAAPHSLRWHYEPMVDERHDTVFAIAALRGVRAVFAAPGH
jgi:predicted alpha/beta superfamily hydrolase